MLISCLDCNMARFFPVFLTWLMFAEFANAQADYKKYYDDDRLPSVREQFQQGRFVMVIQQCEYAERRNQPSPEWRTLKMKSLAQLGKYAEALTEADHIAVQFAKDLPTLLDVYEIYRITGQKTKRDQTLELINQAADAVPIKDRDALDLVHLGKAALLLGADPAQVLEKYFGPAKKLPKKGPQAPPGLVEAHLAAGELALDKSDFKLASQEFAAALKHEPNRPDLRYGLARAFLPSDREQGMKEIDKILETYSFHFGALLVRAESAINYDNFGEAHTFLKVILGINPHQPEAWALKAVLAELETGDPADFKEARDQALISWKNNPGVDHLIGRVLSRKYRFREAADSQLRAIKSDPKFLPAKLQLALDYLSLGEEEKTWPLVKEVAEADQYNVLAFNLETLEKEIASYDSIKSEHFIIRLPANEAKLYGDRALALLEEARNVLCPKYGVTLNKPTLVEFFPNQADFAIRSFGSLGGAGLLGVCFGSVVTMNSPGSLTHGKNNWEATLWHEFAHVVTLTATKNKMPRWLSEGISVYEEMQKNPNWGQRMTSSYRTMIVEKNELTPISKMSSAFYNPPSGEHVMFAYYESMLVVEYIVKKHGHDTLRKILVDLSKGILINEALEKNTGSLETLENEFARHVLDLAENLAPGVDWRTPEPDEVNPRSPLAVAAFLKKNPKSFWAHQTHTKQLLQAKNYTETIKAADDFIALYPDYVDGLSNGYFMKATAWRGLGNPEKEADTLRVLSAKSAEAYAAYGKLLTLDLQSQKWPQLLENAERAMAINPFLKDIHYCRGCASQHLNQPEAAITAFEKLLPLNPANPSEVRYRLAELLHPKDTAKARRYLLDALADSPRYRDAYKLLLKIEPK
jgi:tetratricopeptide (TPR) repeat protein